MKTIKRIASRVRLPSNRRASSEGQRNVTPPRSVDTGDAFTTPPHAITQTTDNTPSATGLVTPATPQTVDPAQRSNLPRTKSARTPTSPSVLAISEEDDILPELLEQGVTGADTSLPIFDGLSNDPKDYLIDLDTSSMEDCPDVRVYFWKVGITRRMIRQGSHEELNFDPPIDRVEWDSSLVVEGREYLRDSRAEGQGYYISSDRYPDILSTNRPGDPWYRLPTIGIADEMGGEYAPLDSEGTFFDSARCDWEIGDVFKTNIRVPILCMRMLKTGVVPGTQGWDDMVAGLYLSGRHPAHKVNNGFSRHEVISSLLMNTAGPSSDCPCDSNLAGIILQEIWPGLGASDLEASREEETDPEIVARLREHTGNMDDFLYGKKEYRRKKFLGISFR